MLYKESGLLGISGISNDVRALLASPHPEAKLALDYFPYRASRELGSLTAALGGLDGIVFTARIGENSPELRARICQQAARLGWSWTRPRTQLVALGSANPKSRVSVWVSPPMRSS